MRVFVEWYYERKNKPDELALLLSDLRVLRDRSNVNNPWRERDENGELILVTADPASWYDWLDAVETVLGRE